MDILIHTEADEASTDDVMDWLYYLGGAAQPVIRINDTFSIHGLTCRLDETGSAMEIQTSDGREINTDTLMGNWYRRGQHAFFRSLVPEMGIPGLHEGFNQYYERELQYIFRYMSNSLHARHNSIGNYQDNNINKLEVLEIAAAHGLSIPNTIVTNRFSKLLAFAQQHGRIILKPVAYPKFTVPVYDITTISVGFDVQLLDADTLEQMAPLFYKDEMMYAFAQAYTDKKWEIRSFYLEGSFYSMAIFSQANEQTRTDFRNYDYERPNRCVPYQLPEDIEQRLHAVMKQLQMNSGSFDIIYTPDNRYVFLEVNPIGQYQWLTKNCNYFIDRAIALHLLKRTKQHYENS